MRVTACEVQIRASHGITGATSRAARSSSTRAVAVVWVTPHRLNRAVAPARRRIQAYSARPGPGSSKVPGSARRSGAVVGTHSTGRPGAIAAIRARRILAMRRHFAEADQALGAGVQRHCPQQPLARSLDAERVGAGGGIAARHVIKRGVGARHRPSMAAGRTARQAHGASLEAAPSLKRRPCAGRTRPCPETRRR